MHTMGGNWKRTGPRILVLLGLAWTSVAPLHPVQAAPKYAALMEAVPKGASAEAARELTKELYEVLNASGEYSLVLREWVESHQNARVGRGCLTVSCAVRLGEGLGVEWVLTAALTKEGSAVWNTTLSLISVPEAKVVRVETYRHQGSLAEAVRVSPGHVVALMTGTPPAPGAPVAKKEDLGLPPLAAASVSSTPRPVENLPAIAAGPGAPESTPVAPAALTPAPARLEPTAESTEFPRLTMAPLIYRVFRVDARPNSAPGVWDGQWEEVRSRGLSMGFDTALLSARNSAGTLLGSVELELGRTATLILPDAAQNRLVKGSVGGTYQVFNAGFLYHHQWNATEFRVGFGGFSGTLTYRPRDTLFGGGAERERAYRFTGMRFSLLGAYRMLPGWSVGGMLHLSDVVQLKGSRVGDFAAAGAPNPRMYSLALGLNLSWRFGATGAP